MRGNALVREAADELEVRGDALGAQGGGGAKVALWEREPALCEQRTCVTSKRRDQGCVVF